MQKEYISLKDTGSFSSLLISYIDGHDTLKPFYGYYPAIENFSKIIQETQSSNEIREDLYTTIKEQYQKLSTSSLVTSNIELLRNTRTFTVTTGHQLNLLTGPLYFIYKIITTIRLAETLKEKYPDYNFVPVYWMATEDHDFAEINHFHLFGKTYTWKKESKGPVGKISTEGLEDVFNQIKDFPDSFKEFYTKSDSLAEATRKLVNHLFADKGLIILDSDVPRLKKHLVPFLKKELQNNVIQKYSLPASEKLTQTGFAAQAHIREINLFYMDTNIRERIIYEDDSFKVCNTNLQFTTGEILKLAETHPEKFSPNVLSRPLYQELILPNLAYIGGPAEISYWMQLKNLFEAEKITFPILFPRAFALVLNKTNIKKINKLGIDTKDLFLKEENLLEKYVYSKKEDYDLQSERNRINEIFSKILDKASETDKSLEGFVKAENQKVVNILNETEKKINNAGKKKFETEVSQITNMLDKIFPNKGLQERHDNLLNFYLNREDLIDEIYQNINPFDFRFIVLKEDE